MILTPIIFAALTVHQSTQQAKETLIPIDQMSGSLHGPDQCKVGEPIVFRLRVKDTDVKAYYNQQTEAVRAQVVYSNEQRILADPQEHAGWSSPDVSLVRQDQMKVERVGWDTKQQWFEYRITVVLDKDQQVTGKGFCLAIEILDTNQFDWLRDKPHYLSWGFVLK
ncbi:MAG TPA: hypothetical protein VNI20_12295 [Fimbriimonadaceae bacterium]|nr:hypothetical protein [Fimbriimonadaceae bacterium]